MLRPLEMAHQFLAEVITKEDVVVDATMGNGYDTAFLAKLAALFLLDPVIGGQIVLDRTLLWIIVSEHQPHFRYELHRNLCEKAMFSALEQMLCHPR